MKSKFETKNPLVRQHIVKIMVEFRDLTPNTKSINLYKRGIGYRALTAKGGVLPDWYFSTKFTARVKRYFKGIKKITKAKINTSVEEYYKQLFNELGKILENDCYWRSIKSENTVQLWERVSEVMSEVMHEDIEIEFPELVTYFYNFAMPTHLKAFREISKLNDKLTD